MSGKSISVYVSDEENARITEYSTEEGITFSKWCRHAIQAKLKIYSNRN